MPRLARMISIATLIAVLVIGPIVPAQAASTRIKDIINVEGVRENQLIGYGLVVGLNGTGDRLINAPFTEQALEAMLERFGANIRDFPGLINIGNIAAVMVTANLPAFPRAGSRIDVTVSAIGDAGSLRGGTLIATAMLASDSEVYAVAQGPIAVAGFAAQGAAASLTQGVPTTGRIPNGAIIEKEIDFEFADMNSATLALKNPDFTTAQRISQRVNDYFGTEVARATDPGSVELYRPAGFDRDLLNMIVEIEPLVINTDQPARVVIDDKAGIIVMGSNVRVDEVAIAQGNLTIRITETPLVSQPGAFAEGDTQVVDRTQIAVDTGDENRLAVLNEGVSLQELVDGLNALGVGPRDMISILQSIKAAGALQAEIIVQ